jgi:hypothetical protein
MLAMFCICLYLYLPTSDFKTQLLLIKFQKQFSNKRKAFLKAKAKPFPGPLFPGSPVFFPLSFFFPPQTTSPRTPSVPLNFSSSMGDDNQRHAEGVSLFLVDDSCVVLPHHRRPTSPAPSPLFISAWTTFFPLSHASLAPFFLHLQASGEFSPTTTTNVSSSMALSHPAVPSLAAATIGTASASSPTESSPRGP